MLCPSRNDHVGQPFGHYLDVSVTPVVDQPELPEFIHEKNDLGRRRPDDFSQLFMSDSRNRRFRQPGVAACTGEFQKDTG